MRAVPRADMAAVRTGSAVASAVAGAGLLFVPAVAHATAGAGTALSVWTFHAVTGAALCAVLALGSASTAAAHPTLVTLVDERLGRRAGDTVTGVYLCGFVVGQAALGYAAGALAAAAFGASRAVAAPLAAALVLAAAGAVRLGVSWSSRWRRLRLAATVAVALYLCVRPEALAHAGLLDGGTGSRPASTVLVVYFAFVGWERVVPLRATLATAAQRITAAAVAAVLAGGAYLVLALVLARAAPVEPDAGLPVTGRLAAAMAALLLVAYCTGNLVQASTFASRLRRKDTPVTPFAVALAACVPLLPAASTEHALLVLLTVPASAAVINYCLAMAAVRGHGTRRLRWSATVIAAMLITVATAAVVEWGASLG